MMILTCALDNIWSKFGYTLQQMYKDSSKQLSLCVHRLLLESGVQRGRAHKFYFNQGLTISSYRFQKDL